MTSSGITSRLPEILIDEGYCKEIKTQQALSAGLTISCYYFSTDQGEFFVKVGPLKALEMEKLGLETLAATKTVTVPKPLFIYHNEDIALLAVEYIKLSSLTKPSQKTLGKQLAKMHLAKAPKEFGFSHDNSIGATPQINEWCVDWPVFLITHRIGYQLELIHKKYQDHRVLELGLQYKERIPELFENISIKPSLLHGDLWTGNAASFGKDQPIIFDPCCYYGHSEMELSIMKMFGGFSSDCFDAYHELIPQEEGFDERLPCYQLYHYLNHYNIFGATYRQNCLSILNA